MSEKQRRWDQMYLRWAKDLAETHSYDPKYKVGALIIDNVAGNVVSIGYNGRGKGRPNERISLETGKSGFIHAEDNCLAKASWNWHSHYTLYVSLAPCLECSQKILNVPIKRVVYSAVYPPDTRGIAELIAGLGEENVVFLED